jgi:hypothetical protein
LVAAEVTALPAIRLNTNSALLIKARDEFLKSKGKYKSKLLGRNNKPLVSYSLCKFNFMLCPPHKLLLLFLNRP